MSVQRSLSHVCVIRQMLAWFHPEFLNNACQLQMLFSHEWYEKMITLSELEVTR
jgi:hypothetical protein